jgi:hypothetical protein
MNLRQRLTAIIQKTGTGRMRRWYTPGLFEKYVLPVMPTRLTVLAGPPPSDRNYNCFLYALGLHRHPAVLKISKGFIYSDFIHQLLDDRLLTPTRRPASGDIILYQYPGQLGDEFTHVGVVQEGGKVISKWSWGPFVLHDKFDVPDSYGSRLTFVKAVSRSRLARAYRTYRKL